jgi:serine palmitoyltransferase
MENNDDYKLSTWGSLWYYFSIDLHTTWGFNWLKISAKLLDIKDWILYKINLGTNYVNVWSESDKDFYIRRIYSTTYDCFSRPIIGAPGAHITIALRKEVPIENVYHLVVIPGKIKKAINFGSYNYLGFGGYHEIITPQIIKTLKSKSMAISAFASEVGVSKEQTILEKELAQFLHKEDCIVIPMGFATNSTLIPILAGKNDIIFSDILNHCSMISGMRASKAKIMKFKHNDMIDLRNQLEELKSDKEKSKQIRKIIVIVEGLYSMEGEFCKLKELIALKKAYGFYLYVDEAHSIGALGATGRGITEHLGCDFNDIDILMGTFSKSFAAAGGYICSDKKTIALLKSNCYANVYGSPMSPVEAQQILSCLRIIQSEEGERRIAQLRKNSITFRKRLLENGCHVLGDYDSPVIPVMVYHPVKLKDVSRACLKRGLAIVIVGFPACSITACRIRYCMSSAHSDDDIEKAITATLEALTESSCIFGNTPEPSGVYHAPKVDLNELEAIEKNPREMPPLWETSDYKITPLPKNPKDTDIDLSSYDIFDFGNNKERILLMEKIINEYGCGSCGPRQFYGGTMEHLALEEKLMEIYNTNDAIIYSYGNNVMTSVVKIYTEKSTALVDELCNYPIQLGLRLARANVIKFKHNDINDLKTKLEEVNKTGETISIITEGIFQADGSISPLREMSKLRSSNVLLIVDDSLGVGSVGENLKGSIELANLTMDDIDVLCANLELICNGVGGFVVGKYSVIDKQRLFGEGYIFSASAPPFTCTGTKYSLEQFQKNGKEMREEIESKRNVFNQLFEQCESKNVVVIGEKNLPFLLLDTKNGKNEVLCQKLKDFGFFTVTQKHLDEDWVKSKYIKVNLTPKFTEQKMKEFVDILGKF